MTTENATPIFTVRSIGNQNERFQRSYMKYGFILKGVCKGFLATLAIIAFCTLFAIPWTMIPRTNSIIHQSHWLAAFPPCSTSFILSAGGTLLELISWTQERSLKSLRVYLKIYLIIVIPCLLIYIACYMIWSMLLQFNHPLPRYGVVAYWNNFIIFMLGLWVITPPQFLGNEDFRQKLKIYMIHQLWILILGFINQLLIYFY